MKKDLFDHGGDVFAAARDLGTRWTDLDDFSANVNPLGPPPGLKKHLWANFEMIRHYPDPFASGWRLDLAERFGLSPEQMLAGNGTTALMYLLARVLRPKRPAVIAPAFSEYERALAQVGVKARPTACREEDDFEVTGKVAAGIFAGRPDLVFLANPTSPAGRLVSPEVMDMVFHQARKSKALVVVDEAFLDFTPSRTLTSEVRLNSSLIVLKSLTKFYALPGLRLGYLTGPRSLVKKLLAGFEPWSVNALAQLAGFYCLDQEDYAVRTRKLVDRERKRLAGRLCETGLGRVIPSQANYLLVKIDRPGFTVNRLASELKHRGILVRDCASFQGLLKGYIRVAVKNRTANNRLVQAVKEIVQTA